MLEDGSSGIYVLVAAAGNWKTCGAKRCQGLLSPVPALVSGMRGPVAVPTGPASIRTWRARGRSWRKTPEYLPWAMDPQHQSGTMLANPQGNRGGRLTCFH